MTNVENTISSVPKNTKIGTKTVIAIICAGIVPVIFEFLTYIISDVIASL